MCQIFKHKSINHVAKILALFLDLFYIFIFVCKRSLSISDQASRKYSFNIHSEEHESSVTRCWNTKQHDFFPKSSQTRFCLKSDIFHNIQIVPNLLGYFCKKNCYQDVPKIAQSGHAEQDKSLSYFLFINPALPTHLPRQQLKT